MPPSTLEMNLNGHNFGKTSSIELHILFMKILTGQKPFHCYKHGFVLQVPLP